MAYSISFEVKENDARLDAFIANCENLGKFLAKLDEFGTMGVDALRQATPVDTGLTADSWYYEVERDGATSGTITWANSNVNNGVNIAIILDFGHGTGTGGYVAGRHYIAPAVQETFEQIEQMIDEEVSQL